MSLRIVISLALVTALGVACVSTDAFAYRGGVYRGGAARGGVYRGGAVARGGVYRGGAVAGGGVYRGAYVRPGVGVGLGAAAVGAAVAAPYYNGSRQCGYAPYPPCY
jgi:hypothetical protein